MDFLAYDMLGTPLWFWLADGPPGKGRALNGMGYNDILAKFRQEFKTVIQIYSKIFMS